MAGFLKDLLKNGAGNLIKDVHAAVDGIGTNNAEKQQLKEKLSALVLSALNQLFATQAGVITKEMSGNWLQKSWRPVMMLSFGIVIMCKWFGWTDANISENLELELLSIIKLGLTGYVAGRSLEKITEKVTENIDISFLKKKDRKKLFEE